ncbi:uncharacterized protein LOC143858042 [Tasmannia lanceolata]|uniref:uncharacterized protein LOC143858042 n=1 Tax=Tasmannia lanceolata TaxID=3420 RepID=UPI00406291A6
MEAKLNQNQETRFLKSWARPISNPSTSYSFCLNPRERKKGSLTKYFQDLSERWNFLQMREPSKRQYPSNQLLIHVVKEGETLTSISRQYGVSIHAIAAVNENIVDVDFVLEGQRLSIPLDAEKTRMVPTWKRLSTLRDVRLRCQSSFNISGALENHKIFTVPSSHHLQLAKTTGCFLVLVPLTAFCIRCITGAFHHRVASELKQRAINESKVHHHGSRSVRWRSVLNDIREPDVDAETRQDSFSNPEDEPMQNNPGDEPQVPFEDISHDYTELELAYQKFLSECGMSRWGHWRGGSPE